MKRKRRRKSCIRETMNISTNADSRTDTIFEWLRDFSQFVFWEKSCNLSEKKKRKNLKRRKTTQLLKNCAYYPHRSRYSLSPVCWIKKKSQFITVLPFSPVFFLPFLHPFSPFSTAYHWFSKKFTIYHCFFHFFFFFTFFNRFFTIFNRFFSLTIFNRFPPFCIGTPICKRQRDSVSPVCRTFFAFFPFGDISVLTTF